MEVGRDYCCTGGDWISDLCACERVVLNILYIITVN